jgi:hypothetical protein
MAIPSLKKQLAERLLESYCKTKIPPKFANEIKLSFILRGNNITLIESRPSIFDKTKWNDMTIAQFRYLEEDELWMLYCADRNGKWHKYKNSFVYKDFKKLLKEVDEDPTGIFFG